MLRHIKKAVLVILFVLVSRALLFVALDVNFDNSLSPLLAECPDYSAVESEVTELMFGPPLLRDPNQELMFIDVWTSAQYIFGSRRLAESIGVSTGIMVWVFVAALLYLRGGRYGTRETHCRKCHAVLRSLREPKCDQCGEVI